MEAYTVDHEPIWMPSTAGFETEVTTSCNASPRKASGLDWPRIGSRAYPIQGSPADSAPEHAAQGQREQRPEQQPIGPVATRSPRMLGLRARSSGQAAHQQPVQASPGRSWRLEVDPEARHGLVGDHLAREPGAFDEHTIGAIALRFIRQEHDGVLACARGDRHVEAAQVAGGCRRGGQPPLPERAPVGEVEVSSRKHEIAARRIDVQGRAQALAGVHPADRMCVSLVLPELDRVLLHVAEDPDADLRAGRDVDAAQEERLSVLLFFRILEARLPARVDPEPGTDLYPPR